MPSIIYYTDFSAAEELLILCRDNLIAAARGLEIVTVGLNRRAGFGKELVIPGTRGLVMYFTQILAGLEAANGTHVFMAEHDVLYHPSHFEFVPARADTFYYNVNVWHARYPDGHCVYYDAQQVSGLCASRALLLDFYRARLAQVLEQGPNRHYEPGLHQTVGGQLVESWESAYPNIDIRHGANLTGSKWSPADFRNSRYAAGWQEADALPGWGNVGEIFSGVMTC